MTKYPVETSDETMSDSRDELKGAVVGHKIVKVEKVATNDSFYYGGDKTIITLDNDTQVELVGGGTCCAYTELDSFLLNPELVDHAILGVGTTDNYQTWHIFADMGDVLKLDVSWSEGSGYYGYGFDIRVRPIA